MAVYEELQEIIAEKLSIDPGEIKAESNFIDDLGADSLDLADLVMAIEEKKCGAGAGACVVRISHGEEIRAAAGDTVRAYGRIRGVASWSGKTIPDVEGTAVVVRAGRR